MEDDIYYRKKGKLELALNDFTSMMIVLGLLFIVIKVYEIIEFAISHGSIQGFASACIVGVINDILFLLTIFLPFYVLYTLIYYTSKKAANIFFICVGTIICTLQLMLLQYSLSTLVLLGGDLWQYSPNDIKQIIHASNQSGKSILLVITGVTIIIFVFIFTRRKIKASSLTGLILFLLAIGNFFFHPMKILATSSIIQNESSKVLAVDKLYYFFNSSTEHFFPKYKDLDIYSDSYSGDYEGITNTTVYKHHFINEVAYPFLHDDTTADVLSAYFKPFTNKPNIVIILYEGLGKAFSNEGATFGSFTPFLDSLSQKSLYWENFLSEGGRTFAVLPSLTGSLPFCKNGFAELGDNMPTHLSLLSLLKYNGYNTSFSYGGDARFDMMDAYLKKNETTDIYDINSFPRGYLQLPKNELGYTWGYGDKELYRWYLENKKIATEPYLNIILTVATHDPFNVNDQQYYLSRFEKWLVDHNVSSDRKEELRHYNYKIASILYADDALRSFFNSYAQRPDFNNTIFLITGDHQMPEMPLNNKLDRYHVPFLIYSPLLTRVAKFKSISTHFDVTPTLLAFLKTRCNIELPRYTAWIGTNIDTTRSFRNLHEYPIMQTKNDIVDFVMGSYMLNLNDAYKISSNMDLDKISDEKIRNNLTGNFDVFKQKNNAIIGGKKIIPDSIYNKYHNK